MLPQPAGYTSTGGSYHAAAAGSAEILRERVAGVPGSRRPGLFGQIAGMMTAINTAKTRNSAVPTATVKGIQLSAARAN